MFKPSYLETLSSKAIANTHQSYPLSLGTLLSAFAVQLYLGCSWLCPLFKTGNSHSWLQAKKKGLGFFNFISAVISSLI